MYIYVDIYIYMYIDVYTRICEYIIYTHVCIDIIMRFGTTVKVRYQAAS